MQKWAIVSMTIISMVGNAGKKTETIPYWFDTLNTVNVLCTYYRWDVGQYYTRDRHRAGSCWASHIMYSAVSIHHHKYRWECSSVGHSHQKCFHRIWYELTGISERYRNDLVISNSLWTFLPELKLASTDVAHQNILLINTYPINQLVSRSCQNVLILLLSPMLKIVTKFLSQMHQLTGLFAFSCKKFLMVGRIGFS